MSKEKYGERVAKIRSKLKQLINQGRSIKRPERVNVNVSEWTLARLHLLASYRGVTLSTATDEAIKQGLHIIERDIITDPSPDLSMEREIEEMHRKQVAEINEGVAINGTSRDLEMARILKRYEGEDDAS
jgi:hypothetical protein